MFICIILYLYIFSWLIKSITTQETCLLNLFEKIALNVSALYRYSRVLESLLAASLRNFLYTYLFAFVCGKRCVDVQVSAPVTVCVCVRATLVGSSYLEQLKLLVAC